MRRSLYGYASSIERCFDCGSFFARQKRPANDVSRSASKVLVLMVMLPFRRKAVARNLCSWQLKCRGRCSFFEQRHAVADLILEQIELLTNRTVGLERLCHDLIHIVILIGC